MRRTSAASRTFLLSVALLAGCSIYEPSLLKDAPPDYGEGGSDGDAGEGGESGTGGTDGEGGTEGDAGEGGSDGEAGEGGSDGEAGEGGSDGEAGQGGSEPSEGGASGASGKGGAAGKAGAGGASGGGSGGAGGAAGISGAAGVGGKAGAGGSGGNAGGSGGATGGKAGSAGGGACDGRVLINEVSTEKGAVKSDELVELYNPTACEIVLTGWVLKYAASTSQAWLPALAWTGSETAKIAPGGYFVIGSANYITGGGVADEEGKLGISSPAGLGLFASTSAAEPTDRVAWGNVVAGSPAVEGEPSVAPSSGKSVGRSSTSADTDDNKADFTDQERSPGAANP